MGLGQSYVPPIGSRMGLSPQVAAPTFPSTGTFVQNTNPYHVVAYIGLPSVTYTHAYLNTSASATGAVDLVAFIGASATAASSAATIIIPAGLYFALTYSGGTPIWIWVGGL